MHVAYLNLKQNTEIPSSAVRRSIEGYTHLIHTEEIGGRTFKY